VILPDPSPAVAAALPLLPATPGVYRMRDAGGRVLYVGRSGDLRARVRSYWRDLRDRPHLASMLRSAAWVEPTLCASEHEAALFERHLLTRRRPPYNRITGVEQLVHLRLATDPAAPSLDPVVPEPGDMPDGELFGPYLGWEPVRLAAAGLNRLYPVRYTADRLEPSLRELARSRGVGPGDRRAMAGRIRAVLERRPRALAGAVARLTDLRDRAAAALQFESAAELQRQLDGLRWVAQARPRPAGYGDADVWASAGSLGALLEVRAGRLRIRTSVRMCASSSPFAAHPDGCALSLSPQAARRSGCAAATGGPSRAGRSVCRRPEASARPAAGRSPRGSSPRRPGP
jgi:excinuclease ABC subunit C